MFCRRDLRVKALRCDIRNVSRDFEQYFFFEKQFKPTTNKWYPSKTIIYFPLDIIYY